MYSRSDEAVREVLCSFLFVLSDAYDVADAQPTRGTRRALAFIGEMQNRLSAIFVSIRANLLRPHSEFHHSAPSNVID